MLHGPDKLIKHRPFQRRRLAFDLNANPRSTKPERIWRCEDINPAIRSCITSVRGESLGIQNRFNKAFEFTSGELAIDESGYVIPTYLLKIQELWGQVIRVVVIVRLDYWKSCASGLPPVFLHCANTCFRIIALHLTNGCECAQRVENILVEIRSRDIRF